MKLEQNEEVHHLQSDESQLGSSLDRTGHQHLESAPAVLLEILLLQARNSGEGESAKHQTVEKAKEKEAGLGEVKEGE